MPASSLPDNTHFLRFNYEASETIVFTSRNNATGSGICLIPDGADIRTGGGWTAPAGQTMFICGISVF